MGSTGRWVPRVSGVSRERATSLFRACSRCQEVHMVVSGLGRGAGSERDGVVWCGRGTTTLGIASSTPTVATH